MPALGMAQETGTILRWLKAPGERVESGEPLMEIETDKATVEIEAPASGLLAQVTAWEGDEVPVGTTVALIVAEGEPPPEKPAPEVQAADRQRPSVPASPIAARMAAEHGVDLSSIRGDGGRVTKLDVLAYLESRNKPAASRVSAASPKARRLAAERGVDLRSLAGSGPGGAVLAEDVLAVRKHAAKPPATVDLSPTWKTMARRVTGSWTTVPHFFLTRQVRVDALLAWHAEVRGTSQHKITLTDVLASLLGRCLRTHPRINVSWQDGELVQHQDVNLALAVATDQGLVAPVIHHTDELDLEALAARRAEVVSKAKQGKLDPPDLQGGTFTLTNLGMFGVDSFQAIVNPPQAAILAAGRVAERVVPIEGEVRVANVMTLTLSCDHRAIDGALGAKFLEDLAVLLEEPTMSNQ